MSEPANIPDQGQVMADVRRALGRSSSTPPHPLEPFLETTAETDIEEVVTRFISELTAVGGHVYRLESDKLQFVADVAQTSVCVTAETPTAAGNKMNISSQIADHIAAVCQKFSVTDVALSGSPLLAEMGLAHRLTELGLTTFVPDESAEHDQLVARLAAGSVGVTAADYGIAETGTIVLSSDETHALLVSLLPPIHIALLSSKRLSAGLDQVISKIASERVGRVQPSRSVSFITGPSRTSDVELTLSIGVHGPKELHVIIFDE